MEEEPEELEDEESQIRKKIKAIIDTCEAAK